MHVPLLVCLPLLVFLHIRGVHNRRRFRQLPRSVVASHSLAIPNLYLRCSHKYINSRVSAITVRERERMREEWERGLILILRGAPDPKRKREDDKYFYITL